MDIQNGRPLGMFPHGFPGAKSDIAIKPDKPLILLARSERFELPTLGFEVRCSIQLSYERLVSYLIDIA
jgi:hypothetical protein